MRKVMAPEAPFPMAPPQPILSALPSPPFAPGQLLPLFAPAWSKHPGLSPQWHFCSRPQGSFPPSSSLWGSLGRAHPTLCDPELIPTGASCTSSTGGRLDPASSSPFPLSISCRPGLQPREGTTLGSSAPTRSQPLRAADRLGRGGRGWWEHCSPRAVTVWPCHPHSGPPRDGDGAPSSSSHSALASLGQPQTPLWVSSGVPWCPCAAVPARKPGTCCQ